MTDERAIERRGAVDVMQLPRLIGGALADIRRIADGMATLPKLLVSLNSIDERVELLNEEVTKMRTAVESMGGDVSELSGGIDRLESHVDDVARVAHPLRRISRRRPRDIPDA
jgi:methyl-accepting chemotaxis protein